MPYRVLYAFVAPIVAGDPDVAFAFVNGREVLEPECYPVLAGVGTVAVACPSRSPDALVAFCGCRSLPGLFSDLSLHLLVAVAVVPDT